MLNSTFSETLTEGWQYKELQRFLKKIYQGYPNVVAFENE